MAVVFDLEGTLTRGATWKGVGRYVREHRSALRYSAFFAAHLPGVALVNVGLMRRERYKITWITDEVRLLAGADAAEVQRMAAFVVEEEMWPRRRADVLAELEAHRAAGERVLIASGTYQPIAGAFAARLGVEALGTALEVRDGRLTGRLAEPVQNGAHKVDAVRAYLGGEAVTAAYGDTAPDAPLLAIAAAPTAVYPDDALRQMAVAGGWRILDGES